MKKSMLFSGVFICICIYLFVFKNEALGATEPLARFESEGQTFEVRSLFKGTDVIWAFQFLPDRHILFTEREGKLKILNPQSGKTQEVSGVPEVAAVGQGGLLDLHLHPEFEKNSKLYLTYAVSGESRQHTTVLAQAELSQNSLKNLKVLFMAEPERRGGQHFGSRVLMDQNGYLFLTVGERGDRDQAQKLDSHLGKVIRLNTDGSIPGDNPFREQQGARPEIWSYGHRNAQGLVLHPETQKLWLQEHGPRGGDEINIIEKGKNYGWPVITYGREYFGPKIGVGTEKDGMEQPVHHWTPSIAPSGLTFYSGDKIPRWKGNLFSGALVKTHLNRLVLNQENKVVKEERLLEDLGKRIRDVREGPDEYLYFSTDDGYLFKIMPQSK